MRKNLSLFPTRLNKPYQVGGELGNRFIFIRNEVNKNLWKLSLYSTKSGNILVRQLYGSQIPPHLQKQAGPLCLLL
jgi:hypothetical protein